MSVLHLRRILKLPSFFFYCKWQKHPHGISWKQIIHYTVNLCLQCPTFCPAAWRIWTKNSSLEHVTWFSPKEFNLLVPAFLNCWNWPKYVINSMVTQTQGNTFWIGFHSVTSYFRYWIWCLLKCKEPVNQLLMINHLLIINLRFNK